MTSLNLNKIIKDSQERIAKNNIHPHKRSLYNELINCDEQYFQGIVGLRGIGKTVVLCQLAKEKGGIYISLDSLNIKNLDFIELLESLSQNYNTKRFYLDEIHHLPEWDKILKNLYDSKDYKIYFTGSSAIDIINSSYDLSRRVIIKKLSTLSFREYLLIKYNKKTTKLKFEDFLDLNKRNKLAMSIAQYVSHFNNYLKIGGFPFIGNPEEFIKSFENTLNTILYRDIPAIKKINEETIQKIYKILSFVANSGDEISPTNLASDLNVSKNQIYELLSVLGKTMLITEISPCGKGRNKMRRNTKYTMPISVRYGINKIEGLEPKIGHLREDFFIQALNNYKICFINSGKIYPDFKVNENIFEIGGKNKGKKQIKGEKNAYLCLDTLTQDKDTISLYLFGFI